MRLTVRLSWYPMHGGQGLFMELTLEKSKTDPGSLNKEHCIPLAELLSPSPSRWSTGLVGTSRYLGITKHLYDCRADLPSPYKPSGPSTAFSIGNQGEKARGIL